MMPLTGWLAGRFGIKYVFLLYVAGNATAEKWLAELLATGVVSRP